MGVDRQGSKTGGGYVGGFLHLFDWNAKSRKKLFSGKSDLPEQSKQKKRDDGNYPLTQLHLMDQDDCLIGSSFKGSSDYSCASSVTDEEGGGSKAPGVVAKLMGLDSLPTSIFSEAYSTPFFDSRSVKDAYYCKKNNVLNDDHQSMHSANLFNRLEDPLRNNVDTRLQKTIGRPFEKFQSEVLPPKSAKSIPLTHHKLLSPIKSGGFVPSKNVVHIMEAAARIIESGNQVSTKAKMPPVGSSVPLKVRDLKERAEAAKKTSKFAEASRKPAESIVAKNIKGQSMNKSWNGSLDTKTFRASSDFEEISAGSKNKGKSVSLAVQAKVNVQKREGLNPSCSRNSIVQKEQGELTSSQIFKSQPSSHRSSHKKLSTNNPPSVLRQNNQKQNCVAEREKAASKSVPSSNSQGKKVVPGDSSLGRQRSTSKSAGNGKVGSRKLGREMTDDGKEVLYSSTCVTRKKRCMDGEFNFQKDHVKNDKNGKSVHFNGAMDGTFSWADDSKSNGMDIVSFTFTAPMGRSTPSPETSREAVEKNNSFSADFLGKKVFFNSGGTRGLRSSSIGSNMIGGDALTDLLEQKLRELALGVESSRHKGGKAGSTGSSFQDETPLKEVTTSTKLHAEGTKMGCQKDSVDKRRGPVFSSTSYDGCISKHKVQEVEDMFDCASKGSDGRNLPGCRHPSPISILETSIFTESSNSSDTGDSNSTEGLLSSKQSSSSVQAQDIFNMRTSKKFHIMEADADLSDSASSSSTRVVAKKHAATLAVTDPAGSTKWELEYVKKITCITETMYNDFACGQQSEIIDHGLFDQLENREEEHNLQRKLLFDCVGECMDFRFRQYGCGGYKAWEKGLSVVSRKNWLAEEVHKEISSWEAMGDCMVDELVDKDMSSQCGKWLDYEVEAFELGVDIERRILNSLLNEVISDILVL